MKFALLDDPREVIGAALKYLGYSVNTAASRNSAEARNLLRRTVRKKGFESFAGGPKSATSSSPPRSTWGRSTSGDLAAGRRRDDRLKVFLPQEGTTISTDTLVLLRGSPNPGLARTFLNYVLNAEVSAAISNYTYYGNPNRAARPLLDPLLLTQRGAMPTDEDFRSGR
ncbi:spermidine/putrescine ABC transporter substrate-binding protein, partial [Methylobacterium radiotolerans]